MDARAPESAHALQLHPELVPAHSVGAAQLEETVHNIVPRGRLGKVGGNVVDPDRLDALAAAADDRRDRREARELHEGRQDAAVRAEDETRTKDDVGNTRRAHQLLRLPLRAEVGDEVLRLLARPECAHVHEPPHAGLFRCREQVPRPVHHDPAELLVAPLPDGDEVHNGLRARNRAPQTRRIGDVPLSQLRTQRR